MSIKIVMVALSAAIPADFLKKMHRLAFLVTAGEACERFDQVATCNQGVELLAFPAADLSNLSDAQDLCNRISHDKTGGADQ